MLQRPVEPELVDDVLAQTEAVQRRLRLLPSRAGAYFVLALAMFPHLGYLRVWTKLTAGLAGMDLACPSKNALRDLRRRLGPAPLKALFELVAGPLAQPHTPGVRFAGLRTVAFDGLNSLKVPDTGRNRSWAGKIRHRLGMAGFLVAAAGTAAVVVYRFVDIGPFGPVPDMYDPYWAPPENTLSSCAEGLAALAALSLLVMFRIRSRSAAPTGRNGFSLVGSERA